METSSSVDFDSGGDFIGTGFFPAVTGQAQYAAREATEFMSESGFTFFAVLLLFVVLALGVWRILTKGA